MKTRNAFVSNSSSSSFIFVGWQSPGIEIDYDKAEELNCTYYGEEDLVGVSLPDADDYAIEAVDMLKVIKIYEDAKQLQEKLGIEQEPKLIYGMRQS